jgi:hypothetical protein
MGLVDLTTDLKSLKFGKDRVYGGDSKQPYIQTPIPENIGEFGFLNEDFILRGGSKAVTDSALDVKRLGKYFTDIRNPSGLLFIAKQNLLSRTAVRTQASTGLLNEGVYTPLSTLAQAAGNAFGLHVNKQGLNPFDGPGSLTTYTDIINSKIIPVNSNGISGNRLTSLYTNILINNTGVGNFGFLKGTLLNSGDNILSYIGGPGSILGVGRTNIRFATDNTGAPLRTIYTGKEDNILQQNKVLTYTNKQIGDISSTPNNTGESFLISKYNSTTVVGDFRKILRNNPTNTANENLGLAPNSLNYTNRKNIEQRVGLGNPGDKTSKNLKSYVSGSAANSQSDTQGPLGAASPSSYDKITVIPIYSDKNGRNPDNIGNDLVKFRIGVYDLNNINNNVIPKNYIHFRAFLNQISDNYSADWSATKYIGRGENFYTYSGFDRKVSLSWTVTAQSKVELIPMYKKLNYLASVCAPDYSSNGYMRGNIVTLTIGGYFYEQPGIITGFNYSMNDDNSSWEIGINDEDDGGYDSSVKELPHLIKVEGFNFIPIHDFVPKLQQNKYSKNNIDIEKPYIDNNTYGKERYIALSANSDTKESNYGPLP